MTSRRQILKSLIALPVGLYLPRLANAEAWNGKTLVCVFQRGAVDGLSMLVPYAEASYYDLRNTISIAAPSPENQHAALELNDQFALHPALRPLHDMYKDNKLVAIPACGSPDTTRSHFDAQDYMESGVAGDRRILDGWMNRAMAHLSTTSVFNAISMTTTLPRALRGGHVAINIPNLEQYEIGYANGVGKIRRDADAARVLQRMYANSAMAETTGQAFHALKRLRKRKYKSTEVDYPDGIFSNQLMQLAQLIKSDLGVSFAFVETGGWDTHANQGGAVGQLAGNLYQLGHGLSAFFKDLGEKHAPNVVAITMSEFGRTVKQNGNQGTDHGHGTTFLAMGAVDGGRVLGDFPGLRADQLYQGRDVAVTTDYRDVLAEILHRHMGLSGFAKVFPGYGIQAGRYPGVYRRG